MLRRAAARWGQCLSETRDGRGRGKWSGGERQHTLPALFVDPLSSKESER